MAIRHLIFDCDGVLVDSEPLSMQVDVELLAEAGVHMSAEEAHSRFVGRTFASMIAEISKTHGVEFPRDISAEKDRRLLALYARSLQPVPGLHDALQQLPLTGHSIGSNSPVDRIEAALRLTGLTRWFDRITTFEHVAQAKPAPDIFVEAARRAGMSPAECIVVEDSVTGVTAAAAAGCRVLGFTGTHPHPEAHALKLLHAGASLTFRNMAALPVMVMAFSGWDDGELTLRCNRTI